MTFRPDLLVSKSAAVRGISLLAGGHWLQFAFLDHIRSCANVRRLGDDHGLTCTCRRSPGPKASDGQKKGIGPRTAKATQRRRGQAQTQTQKAVSFAEQRLKRLQDEGAVEQRVASMRPYTEVVVAALEAERKPTGAAGPCVPEERCSCRTSVNQHLKGQSSTRRSSNLASSLNLDNLAVL